MGSFANRLNPFRYVKTHKPLTIKQMRKVLKTRVFAAGIFFLQDRGTLVKLTFAWDEYLYTSAAYLYKNRMTHHLPRYRQTPDGKSGYRNGVTYFHATLLRIATVYPTFCYINANHVIHS